MTVLVAIATLISITLVFLIYLSVGQPQIKSQRSVTLDDISNAIRLSFLVVGGIGGSVALVVAYRRQKVTEASHRLSEIVAASTNYDSSEKRWADLYMNAVGHLGSRNAAEQMGAIYALERVAQGNTSYRQLVVDVYCAYLRLPYRPLTTLPGKIDNRTDSERTTAAEEAHVRLNIARILRRHLVPATRDSSRESFISIAPDAIQRSMLSTGGIAEIEKWVEDGDNYWEGIHLDFKYATLVSLDLRGARVKTLNMAFVRMIDSALLSDMVIESQSTFEGSTFHAQPWFSGTVFGEDSTFRRARFKKGASFNNARFASVVDFVDASFARSSNFLQVNFMGDANFDGATFRANANFREAEFHGDADFGISAFFYENSVRQGTQFRRRADFQGAQFDGEVRFVNNIFYERPNFNDVKFADKGFRKWPEGWSESRPPDEPFGTLQQTTGAR